MLQTRCPALMQLTIWSADRYSTLAGPRGQPAFYKTGELQLARTPDELHRLQGVLERALAMGVDGIEAASLVSPFEAALLHPLMNAETIVGGLYWGPDATLAPGRVCADAAAAALARKAMSYGAEFIGGTEVARVIFEGARVAGVRTADGRVVRAGAVVIAGYEGAWDIEGIGHLRPPVAAVRRTWHLSDDIDELGACSSSDWRSKAQNEVSYRPVVFDPALSTTVVQLGSREALCSAETLAPHAPDAGGADPAGRGPMSSVAAARHAEVLPALGRCAAAREQISEVVAMAPDGLPLVGPFGAEGLWLAEAVEPDYAFGAGRMLASWMSVGNALVDAAAVDPRRFAPDRARRAADAADAAESAIYAFGAWSGAHEDLDVGNPKLMNAAYGLDELIVSFAYDIPEARNATSAIWAAVAARCAELGVMVPRQLNRGVSGVHALSAGSSLLFAQACPQRVTSSFAGRAQAVAMPIAHPCSTVHPDPDA